MMDDLISRRQARLERYYHTTGKTSDEAADAIEELVRNNDSLYKKLNEAHNEGYDVGYWAGRRDYEQKWIPCSERLPIAKEEVIVSCHDDSGDTSYDYTTCGWVTSDGEYWIADNEINSHVVAWMPLPKPYKVERKEE